MTGTLNLNTVANEVKDILSNSQDYPFDLDCTNLVNQWYEAKKNIIEKFEGQTIWKHPEKVEIQLANSELRREFDDFMIKLKAFDSPLAENDDFIKFLESNFSGFFSNIVVNPPENNEFGIVRGSKLLKSFKRFAADNDVREIQDLASRYIQRSKIEGYLYFSVDPTDFLTLSENNENWTSCHTLDGDYRGGNLSYMVDNTTIIAYICDGLNKRLKVLPEGYTWNSKKWRMLIHTNFSTIVYYNRQYPYSSRQLLELTHDIFTEKFMPYLMSNPVCRGFREVKAADGRNVFMFSHNQITFGSTTYDSRELIDDTDYIGYCDLISSNLYAPIFSYRIDRKFGRYGVVPPQYIPLSQLKSRKYFEEEKALVTSNFSIKVGGKALCPCCGKQAIERSESFLCEKCIEDNDAEEDFFNACCSCGHKIYPGDKWKVYKDEIYCKKCYNRLGKYWGD